MARRFFVAGGAIDLYWQDLFLPDASLEPPKSLV